MFAAGAVTTKAAMPADSIPCGRRQTEKRRPRRPGSASGASLDGTVGADHPARTLFSARSVRQSRPDAAKLDGWAGREDGQFVPGIRNRRARWPQQRLSAEPSVLLPVLDARNNFAFAP